MKASIIFKALAVTITSLSLFATSASANRTERGCEVFSSGVITGNATLAVTGDCAILAPISVAGNLTLTSGDSGVRTLTRAVSGNFITVDSGATLTLADIIIDGGLVGSYSAGGGGSLVFVRTGGSLIMSDGAVLRNNAALAGGGGGGVFVDNGGIFTMSGGVISGSQANTGGGVVVGNGSVFTMSGGEISGNISAIGGGVFMRHGAEFNLSGGMIHGNTANDLGGGVFVNDAGVFTMSGGMISGNVTDGVGGGVNVWGGVFTLSGGAICGNTAATGNCVFVYDGSVFNNEIDVVCGDIGGDEVSAPDCGAVVALSGVRGGKLTAGPNPVSKAAGRVTFFYTGDDVSGGKLTVYAASGRVVTKVRLYDGTRRGVARNALTDGADRRVVGSWDLRDAKGRPVVEGSYSVRGVVVSGGKKDKVSVMLGVR